MSRILALDYGEKRIGAALSDETGTIAQALSRPFDNNQAIFKKLAKLVREENVDLVILGDPKTAAGRTGASSQKARAFGEALRNKLQVDVKFVDERFSTKFAFQRLREQDLTRRQGKDSVDNLAAQVILQQYLDHIKKAESNG